MPRVLLTAAVVQGPWCKCSRRARTVHTEPQNIPDTGSPSPTDALRGRELKRAVTELPSAVPRELPHAALFTALRKTTEICKYFPRRGNIDFCQRELRAEALALNKREITKKRLLSLSCRQLGLILGQRPHPRGAAGAEPGGMGKAHAAPSSLFKKGFAAVLSPWLSPPLCPTAVVGSPVLPAGSSALINQNLHTCSHKASANSSDGAVKNRNCRLSLPHTPTAPN